MPHDIADRILHCIAANTSRRPARARDVAAQVGGPEAEYWAALESLVSTCQVATAHIQRMRHDPEPWLAIWPTGVRPPAPGRLTGAQMSGLFAKQVPLADRLRQVNAPKVRAA